MADFSLKAVFGLDATGVKTELKSLRRDIDDFAGKMLKLGAGAGIAAFAALSKGAMDLAGNLADASGNIGINVESLQALQAQHKRNGVSEDQLQKALEKTKATVIDAANGNKQAAASLAQLGLKAEDLIRLPLDKQYEAIANGATNAKDESQAYSAVCSILGEKVGPKLMGSLKELSGEGLDGVVRSAREAGQVMSTETIVALDKASDAIDDFKKRATVAVGEIIVNFRSEEGLKLLWLQFSKIVLGFGAGIADAIVESGGMVWAVFKGAFKGVVNYWQDAMVDTIKLIAYSLNKVLPDKYEINIGNLDALKSTGKSVSDEITDAIAQTKPSGFKAAITEASDKMIADQKKIVDALNAKDLGAEAKKLRDAGESAGRAIADGGEKAGKAVDKGATEGAKAIEQAGEKMAESVTDAAASAARTFTDMFVEVTRVGDGYIQQSTAALRGLSDRIENQLVRNQAASVMEPRSAFSLQYSDPMAAELEAVRKELKLRSEVSAYATRYGEDAARGRYGDTVTDRALRDMQTEQQRTTTAVERLVTGLQASKLIPAY